MMCPSGICEYIVNNNQYLRDKIEPVERIFGEPRGIYFGISKKWPDAETFLQQFNRELDKLRSEGYVKEINKKYLDR